MKRAVKAVVGTLFLALPLGGVGVVTSAGAGHAAAAAPAPAPAIDLETLTADCGAQLADVKKVNLYFNAGTHVLDDVELH